MQKADYLSGGTTHLNDFSMASPVTALVIRCIVGPNKYCMIAT